MSRRPNVVESDSSDSELQPEETVAELPPVTVTPTTPTWTADEAEPAAADGDDSAESLWDTMQSAAAVVQVPGLIPVAPEEGSKSLGKAPGGVPLAKARVGRVGTARIRSAVALAYQIDVGEG